MKKPIHLRFMPVAAAAVVTVVLIAWLSHISGPLLGDQEFAAQIDQEDTALCTGFCFAPGSRQEGTCTAALADLRRRHEKLLASREF